ncbi:MAG TPA: cation diffusion facilitator family transporter [Dehalococcoidia bacterium]|nr:cation diffusion facilitator family transporter [Dehalococcoidia bacterium]
MTRAPVRIAAISLVATAGLLALKLTLGLISDSIAVLGDAVDSGTDLTAATAALVSIQIAARPADEDHPYGHGKVESLSAGVAATIIALGGTFVVVQAVRRLLGEQPEINVGVGLAAMITAAVVNIFLAYFMRRAAVRSQSLALRAESTHLQTNVVQASTIIVGLVLVAITGREVFDPLVALGLAVYMGYTAYGLVRTALSEIMDEALPAGEVDAIEGVLETHPEVRSFHQLRTRRIGATRQVDLHMSVDASLTVAEVHVISEEVEREIEARLPGTVVVIHVEPHEESHPDFEILVRHKADD